MITPKATPPSPSPELAAVAHNRCGRTAAHVRQSFLDHLFCGLGRLPMVASRNDAYTALALSIRDRVLHQGVRTMEAYAAQDARIVAYLSAEFLPGPHLANNLLNLDLTEPTREAMGALGLKLEDLVEQEEEPGLGNGGLGRLAACFVDSLATLDLPAVGYGIRYEFGIFRQTFVDGWQTEQPDTWLLRGNPWEFIQPDDMIEVGFGGYTEHTPIGGAAERALGAWPEGAGSPMYTPIPATAPTPVNILRLWRARGGREFDFQMFDTATTPRPSSTRFTPKTSARCSIPMTARPPGSRTAAAPAVLLRRLLAARHAPPLPAAQRPIGRPSPKRCRSNSTTRTRSSPSRVHAHAGRPARAELGQAWRITQRRPSPTPTTRCCPKRWRSGPSASSATSAAAPPRNHLRDQPSLPRRTCAPFPGDEAAWRACRSSTRPAGGTMRMANLASVGSFAINGVARLHSRVAARTRSGRLCDDVPGSLPEQDQRRQPAAVS
jgi:starch phosphorylase